MCIRDSTNNGLKVLSIALALIISLLSLVDSGESAMQLNDKLIHFSVYAILTYITLIASRKTNIFVLLAIILSLGICLEFAQSITGLRNFEYMDIIANSFGVLGGYIIFSFMKKSLKKNLEIDTEILK